MENKKVQGYVYAVIMGLLTAIICLAIAFLCFVIRKIKSKPEEV